MRTEHRSAWPRGVPGGRAAKIAIPSVIALVLGLILSAKLVSGSSGVSLSAQGDCVTPAATTAAAVAVTPTPSGSPSATTPALTATATPVGTPAAVAATPAPTATPLAAATCPTPTPTPTATATAAAPVAAANVNCNIIVPANPLSAQGLATPYQLTGTGGMTPAASGCTMANAANLGAFVQATILDPATGALSVYDPLVITAGDTPAAAPVVPTLPARAVVTIDFGFNGTNLTQVGASRFALRQGRCVNGLGGSIFGQVSFCNGTGFFQAAARAMARGTLVVPAAGTSTATGQACPTTRSFTMTDQDQSDNVTDTYLLTANGQTAQSNAANQAALAGATPIGNGSDNRLLDNFIDPTIGCTPFTAPDLTQGGTAGTSQALDELSAIKNQAAPAALVPENDPMTLDGNGNFSATKTNIYRSNVGQPPVSAATDAVDGPGPYCANELNLQTTFLSANQTLLATGPSPVPGVGNNLLTFLANRLSMSFTNLNCQNFGLNNPITVTLDGNGAATAATFNTAQQTATGGTATGTNPVPGRRHHHGQNLAGM